MKFSLFNNFAARNGVPVMEAFGQGLDRLGHTRLYHDMTADVAVIWSMVWGDRMRENKKVWDHFRSQGKPVVVLEVGMLNRDTTWKVGLNGTGLAAYPCTDYDPERVKKLQLKLQPWTNTGTDILIAAQRGDSEQWAGQPSVQDWVNQTVATLQQFTDRPILVRKHPRQAIVTPPGCVRDVPQRLIHTYDGYNFNEVLSRSWAVVNWNSGPGSQSIIAGVPSFVGPNSLAAPVANLNLADIENPNRPDREDWLVRVAHTEWTVGEIATGEPIKRLFT